MRTALLRALVRAREEGRAVVWASRTADGNEALLDPAADDPLLAGEAAEWPIAEAREALRTDRAVVFGEGEEEIFLRPHNPEVRVVVVGAAHVAQPLVEMVRLLGFVPIVVDPRLTFATDARFPDTRILTAWPAESLEEIGLGARTAVIALSHDPKLDDPALLAALPSPAFYVGALGSRRTQAKRRERLLDAGLPEATVDRLHAPVGLDVGAISPAEIALSVAAQLVSVLRDGAVR